MAIQATAGFDGELEEWCFPIREVLGLDSHQRMSPRLEENLCHAAVTTGSYEAASQTAAQWAGLAISPSVIHEHVRRAAGKAQGQQDRRVSRALDPRTRDEAEREVAEQLGSRDFSLVLMIDGWMRRERGADWGLKPADAKGERVDWKETKSAIVFRLDNRVDNKGRPVITEKFYVSWHGDPEELGRRLHAEALRRGLRLARKVYVVADGAVWIWNLVGDRFSWCEKGLDFYHACQHMWAVAHELHDDEREAREWVEPLLHQLRHGGEAGVLKSIEELVEISAQLTPKRQEAIRREADYFRKHKDHVHYAKLENECCPIGSGAMESTCAQFQTRFKRPGQFWTTEGFQDLMDLEIAWRNHDWKDIWTSA